MAFSKATDELSTFVNYTVGFLAPGYDNILGASGFIATGQTSRQLVTPGRVVLKGRPQYQVLSVEIINLDNSITLLDTRVNTTPTIGQYQVITRVPGNAQSALAVTEIVVNEVYEGLTVRIRYETLSTYADVHSFVTDPFERVVVANQLTKGFNPVYLSMAFDYRLSVDATGPVDPAAVAKTAADYINAFSPLKVIELGNIEKTIRNAYPNIGTILSPIQLTYTLLAPDGQIYTYKTADEVTIFPQNSRNAAKLINGSDLRDPILNASLDPVNSVNQALLVTANAALAEQLADLGVSDRTVRYFANASDITAAQVP